MKIWLIPREFGSTKITRRWGFTYDGCVCGGFDAEVDFPFEEVQGDFQSDHTLIEFAGFVMGLNVFSEKRLCVYRFADG